MAMAAKAKYAGLKGDIGRAPESKFRVRRGDSGSPAWAALVRRLAGKKAVFGKIREAPDCKAIVT
jgi:hypothetical protein